MLFDNYKKKNSNDNNKNRINRKYSTKGCMKIMEKCSNFKKKMINVSYSTKDNNSLSKGIVKTKLIDRNNES